MAWAWQTNVVRLWRLFHWNVSVRDKRHFCRGIWNWWVLFQKRCVDVSQNATFWYEGKSKKKIYIVVQSGIVIEGAKLRWCFVWSSFSFFFCIGVVIMFQFMHRPFWQQRSYRRLDDIVNLIIAKLIIY